MPPTKDILEKTLEAHNDVFADICDGLLFEGRPVITSSDLSDAQPYSFYKADGRVRSQERDVAKRVVDLNTSICILKIGGENQTGYDPKLPLRVFGYDGADYRNQYEEEHNYPVITLVLYFGEKPWGKNKTLHDCLNIPEELKPYVNDYKLNLFEIAFLSDEQINRFHSDFRAIADLIAHRRVDPYYRPAHSRDFDHPAEVRELMSVITGDRRYLEEDLPPERRSKNMDQYLDRIMNLGREEGTQLGREEERAAAEEKDKRRVRRMFAKGNSPEEIADDMELDLAVVKEWLAAPAMA